MTSLSASLCSLYGGGNLLTLAQTSSGTSFSGLGSGRSTPPVFSIELEFVSRKENTVEDLADVLETTYPEQRGFSSRSIKRFCEEKGLHVEELFQIHN